jgi:NAD(P)-dependent dehydrogenase (short-subunit alcohol dehydrogenase family)
MDELHGRVAVVTGAASGVGRALCEAFAAEGMHVVAADVDPARLGEAAEQIAAESGAEVLAVPADVSRREDVDALARAAVERFGKVHVLCNNAGVTRPGPAWELTHEQWEWVIGVDLWGVIHGIEAFVPRMIEHGEPAHVVNTASVGGLVAFPGLAAYSAAKFGVVGLSESLAHDLRAAGAPIGVSVLCPGPIATSFRAHSRALQPGADEAERLPDVAGEFDWRSAEDVARDVVAAVKAGRFWILTHPAYKETIERRCRGIVETDEVVEPVVF